MVSEVRQVVTEHDILLQVLYTSVERKLRTNMNISEKAETEPTNRNTLAKT